MNKILEGYKTFVITNGNVKTVKEVNSDDLDDMNNLKAYDDYINWLCDTFKIECCFTCGNYEFIDDLDCCEGCDEYICNSCIESGCICSC